MADVTLQTTHESPTRMRLIVVTAALLASAALIVASTVLTATAAHAATVTDTQNGMTFSADDGNVAAGATVTSYDPSVGGLSPSIPSTVTIGLTSYSVTILGANAFSTKMLDSVTIPDSVTTIGDGAFYSNYLTTISIPDSVTTIGTAAFADNGLNTASIGNSVITIAANAFYLNHLITVTIPDSVTTIGNAAFQDNYLTTIRIGNSVTTIGHNAFLANYLTDVTIPASVSTMGARVFARSLPLANVVFLGPAPAVFTPAGTAGTLGDSPGPIVHFSSGFAAPAAPGGFTSPTWQGYRSEVNPIATFALGGHGTAVNPVDVGYGSRMVAPAAPTASGWNFTGWYTDSALTTPLDFTAPVTTDVTLYAGWAAIPTLAASGSDLALPLTLTGILTLLLGTLALIRGRRTA